MKFLAFDKKIAAQIRFPWRPRTAVASFAGKVAGRGGRRGQGICRLLRGEGRQVPSSLLQCPPWPAGEAGDQGSLLGSDCNSLRLCRP